MGNWALLGPDFKPIFGPFWAQNWGIIREFGKFASQISQVWAHSEPPNLLFVKDFGPKMGPK